jgi:hypothetical protein
MSNVTDQDRNEMSRLLNIMEGKIATTGATGESLPTTDVAANVDVAAMGDILRRLNSVTDKVSETLITESNHNTTTAIALQTSVNDQGVKIGLYQIQIAEDHDRVAGKQYYNIYHVRSGDVIAQDISLYETAYNAVKLLNRGSYVNDYRICKLFELDGAYTAHKIDAVNYRRKAKLAERSRKLERRNIMEARCQASVERAMQYKKDLKNYTAVL